MYGFGLEKAGNMVSNCLANDGSVANYSIPFPGEGNVPVYEVLLDNLWLQTWAENYIEYCPIWPLVRFISTSSDLYIAANLPSYYEPHHKEILLKKYGIIVFEGRHANIALVRFRNVIVDSFCEEDLAEAICSVKNKIADFYGIDVGPYIIHTTW